MDNHTPQSKHDFGPVVEEIMEKAVEDAAGILWRAISNVAMADEDLSAGRVIALCESFSSRVRDRVLCSDRPVGSPTACGQILAISGFDATLNNRHHYPLSEFVEPRLLLHAPVPQDSSPSTVVIEPLIAEPASSVAFGCDPLKNFSQTGDNGGPSSQAAQGLESRHHKISDGSNQGSLPEIIQNGMESSTLASNIGCLLTSFVENMKDGQTLVELKDLIRQGRRCDPDRMQLNDNIDIVTRYSRIRDRADRILYLVLRQWIDVLHLYEECGTSCSHRKGQFSIRMDCTPSRASKRKRGNPALGSESAITDHIMEKMSANLERGSPLWLRERNKVSKVRKCGGRLASWKARFGEGSLCLALLASARSGPMSSWNDHIMFTTTDHVFGKLMTLVSRQGTFLEQMSHKLSNIVQRTKEGSLQSETFAVEGASDAEILKLPRESPKLLEMALANISEECRPI